MNKLYNFSHRFIMILSLIFTGIIGLCGFLGTCYSSDMHAQVVLTKWDSPLWNFFGIGLFLLGFSICLHFAEKNPSTAKKVLLTACALWILCITAILIVFSKSAPTSDPYTVYHIATQLAIGNTSVIHPTDSYLSYYPQQIGLVAFYEPLIRLWNSLSTGLHAYHFLKIIYAFLGVVIFYFQYLIVHSLFQNDRTDFIYILLSAANFPFIMYTSYLYGEIPSFAAVTIGIYCYLRMFNALSEENKRQAWIFSIPTLLFLTLSVMIRKNSLIIIIAVVLVSVFTWLKNKQHLLLIFALLCTICATNILPLCQSYYEHRAGNTLKTGVTATSYFAMGMQESPRANGWYNAFNFITYEEAGLDTELANEISRAAIRERLHYFAEHPVYACKFYLGKFLSQWIDGTYACREATVNTFGGRHPLFTELYEGRYSTLFVSYCNALQNIIYLGSFLFCLGYFRKKSDAKIVGLPLFLGLIAVFGGFLFHMLWEANSRYIFLYYMLMLPYAAAGISRALSFIMEKLKKNKTA